MSLTMAERGQMEAELDRWAREQVRPTGLAGDRFTLAEATDSACAWPEDVEVLWVLSRKERERAVWAAVHRRMAGTDMTWSTMRRAFSGAVLTPAGGAEPVDPMDLVAEPKPESGGNRVFRPVWNDAHRLWVVLAADGTGLGTSAGGDWGSARAPAVAAEIARGLNKAYALGWWAAGGLAGGVEEVAVSCLDCGEDGLRCANCGGVVAR